MKQVWKCDHCSKTDEDSKEIKDHEPVCSYNPINHHCQTCNNAIETGYEYHVPGCMKDLNVMDGEEKGHCTGWDPEE